MARCIFYIDLDVFVVSVEQVLNPELKGKPAIVGGDRERQGVVASTSYEAPPSGIHGRTRLYLEPKRRPVKDSRSTRKFSEEQLDNTPLLAYLLRRFAHCSRNLLTLGEITTWQYDCSGCCRKYSRW